MADKVQKVTLAMKLQGFASLKNIDKDFKKFKTTLKLTTPQLDKLVKSITKVHGNTKLSKVAFEGQIAALTKLKNNVGIGTVAYTKLSAELDKVRAKMNAVTAAAAPQGGMFARLNTRFQKLGVGTRGALGALAGTATAGLGSTGQLAFAGGAVGGPAGALVGASIGATVDAFKGASSAATYSAEIQRLEIALKGVTKTEGAFAKAQGIIAATSKRLNVPIRDATKQFTQLSASVIGAGGTLDDAKLVFNGVTEAIKATGGGAEDVQSAIRAMSQIFGKGKVSAEELQGQLGERLAGAVVKFAEASGRTLQELQKDLRDGTVGLTDVMKFVTKLSKDHKTAAEAMAASSVEAGLRMQVAMQELQRELGDLLVPIGAFFQNVITMSINATISVLNFLKAFADEDAGLSPLEKMEADLERMKKKLASGRKEVGGTLGGGFALGGPISVGLKPEEIAQLEKDIASLSEQIDKFNKKSQSAFGSVGKEGNNPLQQFAKSAFDVTKQVEQSFVNAFKGMEDALVKFVTTGKLNFADLARSIIADITRIAVRAFITKPLFGAIFPNIDISSSAKGNVFAKNKIVPYAKGGIVNKPTLFPMANGMGLMGEAGPEAVMPLKRGANGKLGVISQGGGSTNIVVNVDASGSSVEGNEQEGRELGRLISAAIQSELINQKRPGGLLA